MPNSEDAAKYQLTKEPRDPIWLDAASRVPSFARNASRALFLDVVRNAYYWKYGVAYNPRTATAYELGGGCCIAGWEWHCGDTINIDRKARQSFKDNADVIVLVLAQNHGETYHHALFEPIPRYLAVRPLVEAMPDMKIVIDDSDIVEHLLILLGLDPHRIIRTGRYHPFQFARVLLYPPPKHQDTNSQNYYHMNSVERAVAVLLKSTVLSFDKEMVQTTVQILNRIPLSEVDGSDLEGALPEMGHKVPRHPGRPTIVILERALSRNSIGECQGHRCISNFQSLHEEIESGFGQMYDIKVYPPKATTTEAIPIFDSASIVVGMHGGGFQNIMFCRPGTDVVHIGWAYQYKNTAENFGLRYHLFRMPEIKLVSTNITVEVPKILEVIEDIIERRNDV